MGEIINIIHDRYNDERAAGLVQQIELNQLDVNIWEPVVGNISLAHKQIVKYAQLKGWADVIIGEDDLFMFSSDSFDYFLKNEPKEYDMYLSGLYIGKEHLPNTGNIVKRFSGLHLYKVKQSFYQKFIDLDCSAESIDNALSRLSIMGDAKIVCCYPFAAVQSETFPSTNPIMKGNKYPHKRFFNSTNTYGYKAEVPSITQKSNS